MENYKKYMCQNPHEVDEIVISHAKPRFRKFYETLSRLFFTKNMQNDGLFPPTFYVVANKDTHMDCYFDKLRKSLFSPLGFTKEKL